MIGFLKGTVLSHDEKRFVLLTQGGVGYEVFAPLALLGRLAKSQVIEIWIYTKVSENEISLYGFDDTAQKQFFEKLISISGIGPKMGLQILSNPTDQFLAAVQSGDHVYIAQTPGIGKKMAQKIIVELQGKLDLQSENQMHLSSQHTEAMQALEGLGYDKATIAQVLRSAPENLSAEELVKYFLQSKV